MRAVTTWTAPLPDGTQREEAALVFDKGREHRLLVIPPLFDEANKFRRQLVEIMRRLDLSGIDSVLPDLPGTGDSLLPHAEVTLAGLRKAAQAACEDFRITHCFCVRTGAMYSPSSLPGWRYAPIAGRNSLRSLLRARTLAAQERGESETTADLEAQGKASGLVAGGWHIGPELFAALGAEKLPHTPQMVDIDHETVGGSPLWLRAEPDEDPEQADALAAIMAIGLLGT